MIARLLAASAVLLLGASVAAAQTYRPSFRPDTLTDRPAGAPNEVMVLGTPHLSGLPDTFRPAMVEPLLDRLAKWRPTVIATEDMSGGRCDDLRRRPAQHADTIKSYCYDPTAAGRATGLDVIAAEAEVERTLGSWPAEPTPVQRRRLAAIFLAAGEPGSALVQWLRLPPAEQHADGMLDAALVADLRTRALKKNETFLIAAALAARVGLERLSPVDDQGYHDPGMDDPAYGPAVMKAWDNPVTKARASTADALYARVAGPDGLLDLYRAFNAPDYAAQAYRSDWGAALAEPSPQAFGRRYVGYWETRNLRMVANIREVLGRAPGSRMLAIVGASHKAYYEAYLAQMRDVTLVDVAPLLR